MRETGTNLFKRFFERVKIARFVFVRALIQKIGYLDIAAKPFRRRGYNHVAALCVGVDNFRARKDHVAVRHRSSAEFTYFDCHKNSCCKALLCEK